MSLSIRHAAAVWRRSLSLYRRTWKLTILPNFFEPVFYLTAIGIGVTVGEPEETLQAGVVEVFTAPDARSTEVETTHGPLKVATSQSEGEMAVDTSGLVPLDEEHVYQVWTVVEGEPVPVVVLDQPDTGAHMGMPAPGTQVAITVEPAGGSPRPTTEPIAQLDPSTV